MDSTNSFLHVTKRAVVWEDITGLWWCYGYGLGQPNEDWVSRRSGPHATKDAAMAAYNKALPENQMPLPKTQRRRGGIRSRQHAVSNTAELVLS